MLFSEAARPLFADGKLLYPNELTSCPVCRRDQWRKLFRLAGFDHYRCRQCGFIFVNPRLNDEGAQLYYNSDAYKHFFDFCEKPMNDRYGKWSRTLGNDLQKLADYLQQLRPQGRMLDVGCGMGVLLATMPAKDYDRVGVEQNANTSEYAQQRYGLRVVSDTTELQGERGSFDLVTAVEVIEHVSDPHAFIQELTTFMKPDGILLLTTPNIDCWDYRLYRSRCFHFCAPSHVNFFSVPTLSQLAARSGLKRHDHWYRGGLFSWRHWWRTLGSTVDCWIPESPTHQTNMIVYRRRNGSFDMPPPMPFEPVPPEQTPANTKTSQHVEQQGEKKIIANPWAKPWRRPWRLMQGAYIKFLRIAGGRNQMVVTFRKES